MSNITYPNKNTGDSVSASEFNQIKTSVNSKPDLVNGVFPIELLPESDLSGEWFVRTSDSDPTIIPNLTKWAQYIQQVAGGQTQLATPLLSTGTVTSSSIQLNWASINNATNYIVEGLNGSTWQQLAIVTASTYTVTGIPPSTEGSFRVRATSTNGSYSPSNNSNVVTATTTAGGGTGLSNYSNFIPAEDATITGNTVIALGDYAQFYSAQKYPAGQPFEARFTVARALANGALGVSPGAYQEGDGDMTVAIYWDYNSDTRGHFAGRSLAQDYFGPNDHYDVFSDPVGRLRGDGTRIYPEYSIDGENTWFNIDPDLVISQPNTDLYLKIYIGQEAARVSNIRTTPLV